MEGLVQLLQRDFEVVGVASDGQTMIEMAKDKRPDIIVADIAMPTLNGIDAARLIRKDVPSSRFLFLTMHADLLLAEEAIRIGSSGFILKTCNFSEFVEAIKSVANGATYITPSIGSEAVASLVIAWPHQALHGNPLTSRQRELL